MLTTNQRLRRVLADQRRAILEEAVRRSLGARPSPVMRVRGGVDKPPVAGSGGNYGSQGPRIFILGYSLLGSDDVLG